MDEGHHLELEKEIWGDSVINGQPVQGLLPPTCYFEAVLPSIESAELLVDFMVNPN